MSSDLRWKEHIDATVSKAASRLHFLKQLKQAGASRSDLLHFYTAVVRPVLEYACLVWYSGLTVSQFNALESVQKRAVRIIYPETECSSSDYWFYLVSAKLHYTDTGYGHVVQHHQRTSSTIL